MTTANKPRALGAFELMALPLESLRSLARSRGLRNADVCADRTLLVRWITESELVQGKQLGYAPSGLRSMASILKNLGKGLGHGAQPMEGDRALLGEGARRQAHSSVGTMRRH